jgi:hypothetical protein
MYFQESMVVFTSTLKKSALKACERTSVSERVAAITASATFQDVRLLTEHKISRALDRSKLRRQRTKLLSDNRQVQTDDKIRTLHGFCFYECTNKPIVEGKLGAKFYHRFVTEVHVLVQEPESEDSFWKDFGSAQNTALLTSWLQIIHTLPS